ncbi:MAG: bifunctional dihydroorotate dehydrogenase B NAD binding subunit/NADPH-dependent glutamate synthase [Bacteroidales bacterium]
MSQKLFEILDKEYLAPQIISMHVYAPRLAAAAKPGQFLIVISHGKGERIPLTVCDSDAEKGSIRIVFQTLGSSTQRMGEMKVGDSFADVVGPLGIASEFVNEDIATLKAKKILFVAGSVAAAPVYPQVKWMHDHGIKTDVIIGARQKDLLVLIDEMKTVAGELFICTDDGSEGFHGRVTNLMQDLIDNQGKIYDEVICVGPMIMMKSVSELTAQYKIKTIVSLNTLMVDGTGMCGACRVTVGGKTKFACVDGPEFDGHQVDFAEAMRRQGMYRKYEIARNTEGHACNLSPVVDASLKELNKLKVSDKPETVEKPKTRVPVREQDPNVRNKNFKEVCLGYTVADAMAEASRCLQCKNPGCVTQCPVSIQIPKFIKQVAEGNFAEAARIIALDSALPAVCGRVCPQESQCEGKCILGAKGQAIAIGKLERFVADYARENNIGSSEKQAAKNQKIAVIGSGPAGLTCAGDLAKMGYKVHIFEALHKAGGVLVYGIPEFRLPKSIVAHEIENLEKLGVVLETDVIIGKTLSVDDLFSKEHFDAVFIGSGAGLPKFMHIPGENLNGVVSANELLTRSNLMKAYTGEYETPIHIGKKVAVVGGGNVAMDAARTAKRLGADVYIVYRRSEKEMPARLEEVHHAHEEGIHFCELTNPIEIIGDENSWVKGMWCQKMELGEADASGRRSPIAIPNSEFILEVDSVVMSLGTSPNPLIASSTTGLDTTKSKCLLADETNGQTTRKGIFAGGDAVSGAATVILAMGAARKAAQGIDEYLKNLK